MDFKFTDYSVEVLGKVNDKAIAFLYEAKSSIGGQCMDLTPVAEHNGGNLRASFENDSFVDEEELTAYIGSSLEYAIYQEYGTGEYALNKNGRKGGWAYKSAKNGKTYFTHGCRPKRMLYKAFEVKKEPVKRRGQELFKEL